MMRRRFEDVAEAAGWTPQDQIDILLQYIANQGADSELALAEYAEQEAVDESAGAEG